MLGWNHPLHRRGRQIRRVALSVVRNRGIDLTRAFWWDGHNNFGDAMTPWLLQRYGMTPYLRPAADADLIGVGSILEMVPTDVDAAVWGAGLMYAEPRSFPTAKFLAVRGPLTRDLLGLHGSIPLGDPALLVARFIPRRRRAGLVVAIPHGHHVHWDSCYSDLMKRPDVTAVPFNRSVTSVVRSIAAADLVISSSLHGLIVADAYGIPAVWAVPVDSDQHVADMKFTDHHTAIGVNRRQFDLTRDTTVEELRAVATQADAQSVQSATDAVQYGLVRWREARQR